MIVLVFVMFVLVFEVVLVLESGVFCYLGLLVIEDDVICICVFIKVGQELWMGWWNKLCVELNVFLIVKLNLQFVVYWVDSIKYVLYGDIWYVWILVLCWKLFDLQDNCYVDKVVEFLDVWVNMFKEVGMVLFGLIVYDDYIFIILVGI